MTEESLFAEAVAITDPTAAAKFLERTCKGDTKLRREVEALLAAHGASNPLDRPAVVVLELTKPYVPSREQPGVVVAGRYKLLEEIGAGGMGAVWVAEQLEPVKRKVALKLVKPGMDSRSVLARFEAERQALALMDHPNIAKVHDGGLTETGRPFFVMEYVKGIPITEYCDATRLNVAERLQLFIQVCHAVQHAHQKGVIHRDLKPSNILVAPYDGTPVPKVIDFGLAKAMHQPLTEKTLHTAHDSVLGTPLYMSPEQAQLNNLDVDTRSDIYSLGVLLYELLTGTTPLDRQRFKEAAWDEIRRIIREEEPPRPSARLSSTATLPSLAASRQTEPLKLTNLLRGELDWIVMKALEKERGRRYESANSFAADVERYLTGDPVQAAPPSAGYRLRKFVQRNRGPVTVAVVLALTLIAGIVGTSWGWREALWQRDDAVQARKDEADERKKALKAIGDARDEAIARADAEKQRAELEKQHAENLRTSAKLVSVLRAADEKARIAAQKEAASEKQHAEQAKRHVRVIDATLALERGTTRCERGEIGPGLLWLARGLEVVPDDAHDLKRSLRTLLGGWTSQLHSVKSVRPLPRLLAEAPPVAGSYVRPSFSSDGQTVLLVNHRGQMGEAQLWDVTTDKPIGPPVKHLFISTAALSPDGKTVLIHGGNLSGEVHLWDLATHKPIGPPLLLGSRGGDYSTFSPDGKKFLIESAPPRGAQLWDVVEKKRIAILPCGSLHTDVAFSPDGRIAMTLGHTEVGLWDAETGKSLGKSLVHESGEDIRVTLTAIFSPDIKTLATGSSNGRARLWEVATGKPIGQPLKHGREVNALAFSPDGKLLLTGSQQGRDARLWDFASAKPVGAPLSHPGPVYRVGFSPDGKSIETVSADGVRDWDIGGQKPFHVKSRENEQRSFWPLSPDGKTVVAEVILNARETIGLWDLASGNHRGQPVLGEANIACVAFSPDGKTLVTGAGARGKAHLWDVATGKRRMELQANHNYVSVIAFRPDGKVFLTGGRDHPICTFRLWDTDTGAALCAPVTHPIPEKSGILRAAFSPDGKMFATAAEHTAQRWDTTSRKAIGESLRHQAEITALAFSPNGKVLVTASDDRTVRRWDANTGESLGEPLRHGHMVRSVVFNPAGDLLLTGSLDGTVVELDAKTWRERYDRLQKLGSLP